MNKVERAIIMAAGQGKRMNPITLTTPKPLVKVNGVQIIDTVIQALYKNNIYEIYIIIGYLKEKFKDLKYKYPNLNFIENPYFENCNNISSLYVARNHLENAMILDGDQIIYCPDALSPYFERSGYNSVWTNQHTDEWIQIVKNNIVTSCSRTGGTYGWQLYSISRWTKIDAEKLKRQLEIEFEEKRNDQIYWDDLPMFLYREEYQLGVWEMRKGDVLEIDTLSELIKLDSSYQSYLEN